MSLPPAPKDISEHPQAGSVTVPVNKEALEADVDRKIRFYGVIQAFRQGRMPDNNQIDKTLSYLHDTTPVDLDKLSPEGRKLIQDARDIIETARLIVKQKNADELFQNFVWHTREISPDDAKKDPAEAVPSDHAKLTEDSRAAVRHLRTILSLILTNSEVRKLLSDFSVIGRDLLAKGASKAAEALRPGEEALAHVDEPAPEEEFVTGGGRTTGPGETPVLDVKIPGTDMDVEQHPRADDAKVTTGEGEQKLGTQIIREGQEVVQFAKQRATDVKEEAKGQGQRTKELVGHRADKALQQGDLDGVGPDTEEVEAKKRGLKERIKGVKENLTDRLPQEHKKRTHEHIQRGRQFIMEEYFPEERREQFIYRGKKVIIECQKHDDYQDAVKWLLSVAEEYAELGQNAAEKGKQTGGTITKDPALRQATSELRQLLERFANGRSMDLIFDAVNALNDDARRDEEFRQWFRRLHTFSRKVLLEAGYVLEQDCNHEAKEIRDSGRRFWDQKYRSHFDNLFNSIGDWFSAMGEDPMNKRFGEDWARLTRDLLFDSEGSLKFKAGLWSDIRKVIVPTLVDKVGYVPIPRIEYTDDALDLVVENLTLQGRNLFPNIVSMVAHNYLKFSPYSEISDEHFHEFTFTFAQIQADMRDVSFYFRKKGGFPKVADSGVADVVLGGSGVTATVHLVSAGNDRSSVFKVRDVHVKVGSLKFSIRESKHDLLYKTLKPLATGLVKKQIQKAIAGAIRTGLEYVDGQLVSVRDRMEEAKGDEVNRTQVLQDLFKRHKEEQREHSIRTTESKSQFKVVHTKRASIIDTGHPSGWVNRVTGREEKVAAGKDWRSEGFTIVS
ncbi:hypothetical protein PAXRUDRAFT_833465 [Paxillus rubicundulus Ve08.2h10]|uniref:Uncharacterized protein n=1 Tax=Paxillus rubicundulus Ve08.2h10 TaxID=930991 RepID=A0A0D0DP26_9AGAM|nr:hypothetical protein PAXRUDRAFT_833465 [Paxillus rubicundulus Ve08.2h10]